MFNKKRFGVVALMLVLFLLAGCSFGGKKTYQVVVQTNPPTTGVKVYVGSTEGKYLGETNEKGLLEIEEKLEEGTVLIGVKEGYQVRPEEVKVKGDTVKFDVIVDPGVKARVIVSVESDSFDFYLVGEAPEFDDLELPEEVEVTLDDGSTVDLEVTWQEGDYDPEEVGVYVIKGVLTLVEGIENPDGLQAEIVIEVIDAADAVERYLESLESIEDIEHYSEVDAIEELLSEAEDAVLKIQDPITQVKLQADVLAEAARITAILDRYVKAVQNALGSDLELLEALGTFWDIDEKLITTYQSLMIAANNNGELETVHDIQTIIEKAPEEAAKAEAAAKIIEAAGKDSLIDFRNALIQYGEYLERVNLEHDENYTILKKYKGAIAGLAAGDPVGIEEIQKEIDGVNREQAQEAVKAAVKSLERSDWTTANALVAYMADDEFQDDLAKLDLVLEVVEAAQNGELRDLYEALEELEVKDVAVDLLIEYQEAVKNALKDDAEPALKLKEKEDVADVIEVLQDLVDNKNNELDKFGVTVTQAKVGSGNGLKFTIVAYNKVGKVKTTDITAPSAIEVVIGEGEPITVSSPSPWAEGKIKVDLSSQVTFNTIGEQSGLLTLTIGEEEYEVYFEFVVTADPVDGIVTTDAKEYTAGEMIEITVQLLYKQPESEKLKDLVTLNGEYPAEITIGDRYYSKLLTFTNGVAVAEVRAEKAEDDQQEVKVSVKFEAEAGWVEMTAAEEPVKIQIQAGDAVKLDVTGYADGASLEAQDAYGNTVLTYEGPRTIKVTYEPKGIGASTADYEYEIDPDGQVAVVFSKGQTDVSYGEFKFAPDLEAGKNYTFTFTVVEDGLTGTTDYRHPSEGQ